MCQDNNCRYEIYVQTKKKEEDEFVLFCVCLEVLCIKFCVCSKYWWMVVCAIKLSHFYSEWTNGSKPHVHCLFLANQESAESMEELDEDIAVTQSQVNFTCPLTQVDY